MKTSTKPKTLKPCRKISPGYCSPICRPTATQRAIEKLFKIIFTPSGRKVLKLALTRVAMQSKPNSENIVMPSFTLTTDQQILLQVVAKTASGKPGKVQGNLTWEVIDGSSVTFLQSPKGTKVKIISTDTPGPSTVRVTGDADLGEGVRSIEADFVFEVTPVESTEIVLAGIVTPEPTDKEEDPQPPTD